MSANFQVFLQAIFPYLFQALGLVLGLLVIWAVHKLATKFHVETTATIDQALWSAAHNAVTYAEAWAAKQVNAGGPKPAGTEKMQAAMDFMTNFINSKHLDTLGEAKLEQILETALHIQAPEPIVAPVDPAPVTPVAPAAS